MTSGENGYEAFATPERVPDRVLELLEEIEDNVEPDYWVIGGQAFEGLARDSEDPLMAAYYLLRAEKLFQRAVESRSPDDPYPTAAEMLSDIHLTYMPLIRSIILDREPESLSVVADVYAEFLQKMRKYSHQVADLPLDEEPTEPELLKRWQALNPVFNMCTALGLFTRYQLEHVESRGWFALPAFADLSVIEHLIEHNVFEMWNIDLYMYHFDGPPILAQKIYTRSGEYSQHAHFTDENVSVLWIRQDARLLMEKPLVSPTVIIEQLLDGTQWKNKLNVRTDKVLEAIDKRTIASLGLVWQSESGEIKRN